MSIIKEVSIEEDDLMVSFDVRSLFTNVPIDEAIVVIREMLNKDDTLEDRTSSSVDTITELLSLSLKSTYFCYDGEFYNQKEGAAMGSPVSAVVANLYMIFLETLALTSSLIRPKIWKRYVDDVFCIVKKGMEKELLDHLNSLRDCIQFITEIEKEGCLPFLDCNLKRAGGGKLESSVYRKKYSY